MPFAHFLRKAIVSDRRIVGQKSCMTLFTPVFFLCVSCVKTVALGAYKKEGLTQTICVSPLIHAELRIRGDRIRTCDLLTPSQAR